MVLLGSFESSFPDLGRRRDSIGPIDRPTESENWSDTMSGPHPTPDGPTPDGPTRIGPYELEESLGSGGMGEVFRARDRRLGRRVALKQVRPDTGSAERQARLRREAWAAAQIVHPAVVQVFDVLDDAGDGESGTAWIVMELVDGPTVADRLASGPLPPRLVVRLGRQVAEGLAAAHRRGVIHRDLKAENVMIADGEHAKILDFGLAKPVGAALGESFPAAHTADGVLLGTIRAMSPEQARGRKVDARSDLFSLGVLLYEMASGRSPFSGDGPGDTLARICSHQPPPLHEIAADVPEALSRLVDRLLEKIPEARPGGASTVARELSAIERELDSAEAGSEETPSDDVGTVLGTDGTRPGSFLGAESSVGRVLQDRRTWGGMFLLGLAAVVLGLLPGPPSDTGATDAAAEAEIAVPKTAFDHLEAGRALLRRYDRQGNIEAAIEEFRSALDVRPDYAPAHAELARAYWRRHRAKPDPFWLERGLAHGRRAVELDPELSAARVALALVQVARGRPDEARGELGRVLRLDPANARAHRGMAELALAEGNREEARSHFEKVLRLDAGDWSAAVALAEIRLHRGELDRAEALLLSALDTAPDNAFVYFSLGAVSHFRGDYAEAARRFQRSIEIRPSPAAYSNLGTLYFFQGLYHEAVDAFEHAVELGAHGALVWANLGDAHRWAGAVEEARAAYRRAIQLLRRRVDSHPEDATWISRLALTLAKTEECAEGRRQLSRLPADAGADVLYRAVVANELCDRRDEALATLGRALVAGYPLAEVEKDPELTRLREDVAYHRLVARIQ